MIQVNLSVPLDQLDALDESLLEFGDPRWMLTQDLPTASAKLVGLFDSEAKAREAFSLLGRANEAIGSFGLPQFCLLADEDWRNSYKAHFKAWRFGRLHWVPIWERESYALPAGDRVIWLDPGLAFGTGNHETTRLCCERLVSLGDRASTQATVIDAGCGSGILALSAAVLGFSAVVGFDNDPVAIRISEENAEQNGAKGTVDFFVGDLITGLAGRRADIVLANIQADVLIRFAGNLVHAVQPGGALILSGILAREINDVRAVFESLCPGWTSEFQTLGEWSDLFLQRPRP